DAALGHFAQFCQEFAAARGARHEQQAQRTQQAWQRLDKALEGCAGAGERSSWALSLFGNRARRSLRVVMDHLAAFARQCLAEEIMAGEQRFFQCLSGQLGEWLRELTFCRQRLRYLQENLESPVEEAADPGNSHLGLGVTP